MLAPKLRFKEFNDEWKKIKLKYISTELQYGMNVAATDFDGMNKYIRITDIDDNTHLYNNNPVSPDGKLEEKFLVNTNDILFARTGASTGKTYLYSIEDGRLYFAGFLIRAHIKENNNSRFIFEQTNLSRYKNWLKLTSMRSGQPGINSAEYGNYEFSITNIDEENKIAHFFELLNKKIELQQRKIEVLKMYKRGLINQLYTSLDCSEVQIKDIGEVITGTTPSKDNLSYWSNGTIVWVTPSDITEFKNISDSQIHLTPQGLNAGRKLPKNTLLITCIASIGKNAILKVDGSCNQQINAIIPCSDYDIDFLYYLFEYKKSYMQSIAGTSATSIINKSSFEKILLKIPKISVQKNIAKYLSAIDYKIEIQQHLLNRLFTFKKSLLQQMFI